jgi:myosin heavy subunit
MKSIGLDAEQRQQIFSLAAAVLTLGNIRFATRGSRGVQESANISPSTGTPYF